MGKTLLFSVTPDDCEMQTFTVSGPGGSGKDTSNTGVRFIHPPSGAVGECGKERSQLANKRSAWKKMATHWKMKLWLNKRAAELMGAPNIDDLVDKWMQPSNLKVEIFDRGVWRKEP